MENANKPRTARRAGALAAAPVLAALAVLAVMTEAFIGDVDEDDARSFNGLVPERALNDLAPGMLYAVPLSVKDHPERYGGSPICWFENAETLVSQQDARRKVYVNRLGAALPVSEIFGKHLGWATDSTHEIEIVQHSVALRGGVETQPAAECEPRALRAYQRDQVVCVVEAVIRRDSLDGPVFGVLFNRWAFAPDGLGEYPECPLRSLAASPLWAIKRWFIAVRGEPLRLAGSDI